TATECAVPAGNRAAGSATGLPAVLTVGTIWTRGLRSAAMTPSTGPVGVAREGAEERPPPRVNPTSADPPTPLSIASIVPSLASRIICVGAAMEFGLFLLHTFPAVSKITLQPRSKSWFGPSVSPAGWQSRTGKVASTVAVCGLILLTAPLRPEPSPGP